MTTSVLGEHGNERPFLVFKGRFKLRGGGGREADKRVMVVPLRMIRSSAWVA